MNGREIEHMLSAIDENFQIGRASLRKEILAYFRNHESETLRQLRETDKVTVPTSFGPVEMLLTDLKALVA